MRHNILHVVPHYAYVIVRIERAVKAEGIMSLRYTGNYRYIQKGGIVIPPFV